MDNLIPLTTAKEIRNAEKLPGPMFTRIVKFLSKFTLCFFTIFNMVEINWSLPCALSLKLCVKKLLLTFKPSASSLPMKFKIKKSLIISLLITILCFQNNLYSNASLENIEDFGIISLMYHRFEENKYPSTNIKIIDFKKQLEIIKNNNIEFVNPNNFEKTLKEKKKKRKILLTIDDAFFSFYKNAWPILKKREIPFILFVNTKDVGAPNYMNWDQIKEISKEDYVEIGNHSHTHEYLVEENNKIIKDDILKSMEILKNKLGKNSKFFSYPFGEYSLDFKRIVSSLGFVYAFGQHSGVIDETKDFYELPRFPINEKYGELKRFKSLTKTLPFKYKKIYPEERYLLDSKNPPNVIIEFYENIKNIKLVNCYSNENSKWRQSNIQFINSNTLEISINEKFIGERGRINCSLRDTSGFWRWLGIQFVVSNKQLRS